jgi:hypothetical protein
MKLQIQKTNKMSNKKLVMESTPKPTTNEINKSTLGSSVVLTLLIVFTTFKLTNVINWSWWWVTSPLWAPTLGVLGLTLLSVILTKLAAVLEQAKK